MTALTLKSSAASNPISQSSSSPKRRWPTASQSKWRHDDKNSKLQHPSSREYPSLKCREAHRDTAAMAARTQESGRGLCTLHSFSIPKGLCPPAQGCEGRATLGKVRKRVSNPERVVAGAATVSERGKVAATTLSGL